MKKRVYVERLCVCVCVAFSYLFCLWWQFFFKVRERGQTERKMDRKYSKFRETKRDLC